PMLLHPNPRDALVICFGTGQTSNAVRRENPDHLDIVDLNANVFKLAHFFEKNQNVLDDPRVQPMVMDGRAYIRRTVKNYDVITLEPMPPHFAGVNALYSQEFYQHARAKLRPDGVIAQWLPFHLVAPYYIASIVKTFHSVFPNAILWIDPVSTTGILLGTKDDQAAFGTQWPGFARTPITRGLDETGVRQAVLMTKRQLNLFDAKATIISDDNQLLAYGDAVLSGHFSQFMLKDDLEYIGFPTPQGR
ncbi:MAG: spermine synthase, partial [Alphaproteobacteria bacterium]|nr:spermine synthase [Alphaproteobacteria bacterium]